MITVTTTYHLFVHTLRRLYNAECQLIHTLPRMEHAAADDSLRETLRQRLEDSCSRARRIERLFSALEYSPTGAECLVSSALGLEADALIEGVSAPETRDAAIRLTLRRWMRLLQGAYEAALDLTRVERDPEARVLVRAALATVEAALRETAGEASIEREAAAMSDDVVVGAAAQASAEPFLCVVPASSKSARSKAGKHNTNGVPQWR